MSVDSRSETQSASLGSTPELPNALEYARRPKLLRSHCPSVPSRGVRAVPPPSTVHPHNSATLAECGPDSPPESNPPLFSTRLAFMCVEVSNSLASPWLVGYVCITG